jgi:hypothetical protein
LFFSVFPGAGLMYLGLIKRGIFFMAAFFLSIYLMSMSTDNTSTVAVFMMFVSYLYAFFDGFRVRRLLNSGTPVEDSFDDILSFIKKYWLIVLIMLGFEFVRIFMRNAWGGAYGIDSLFGILILCFGFCLLVIAFNGKKRNPKDSDNSQNNDFIDRR